MTKGIEGEVNNRCMQTTMKGVNSSYRNSSVSNPISSTFNQPQYDI